MGLRETRCELFSCGSGYSPVANSCGHGNEQLGFKFCVCMWVCVSLQADMCACISTHFQSMIDFTKIYFVFKVLVLTLCPVCLFAAFTKSTRVNGQEYELKLVDTAGQDEYSIFPAQYSMDIHGYVLVYSITSSKSFEVVQIIYDKLLDMTGKVQLVCIFFNIILDIIVQLSELHS